MPKELLDLSDETLQRTAFLSHGDSRVPIPSFGPHWASFRQESIPVKDYLAFRGTCRRLRAICELRAARMKFNKMAKIDKWTTTDVPSIALKAVRRVNINIREDDKANVAAFWTSFTSFLASLPRLEELIVKSTPFCAHGRHVTYSTEKLKIPVYGFLTSLLSLSIEVACKNCADRFSRLLVPAAPKLQHLRLCPNDIGLREKERNCLPAILRDWQQRYPGCIMPLRTLYIKFPPYSDLSRTLSTIADICPELESLYIHQYDDDPGSNRLNLVRIVQYHDPLMDELCAPPNEFEMTTYDPYDGLEDLSGPLGDFMSEFACLANLKELDCAMGLELGQGMSRAYPVVQPQHSLSQYMESKRSNVGKAGKRYSEKYEKALLEGARVTRANIPSLRTGYFWEVLSHAYLRWRWNVYLDDKGRSVFTIDEAPDSFDCAFTQNLDGQK